jgi:HEPN domain-containing protein
MVNIPKHISYWQTGAEEDWEVAKQLIESNKIRHGLFFLYMTLEKILKAHICRNIKDVAPRTHNLVRLSELSGIVLEQKQQDLLAEINPFNIEGRYPEVWGAIPTRKEAETLWQRTKKLFEWLKNQL